MSTLFRFSHSLEELAAAIRAWLAYALQALGLMVL